MRKNYFLPFLLLLVSMLNAQIEQTSYRGAFAPAPTPMWTDSWTNYDPKNEIYPDGTVVNITTDITTNTTWTTGKTYYLSGLIYVRNNATLTIQPGVVVKGNYTNSGTALIVTKGSKLNAIGTASQPIVFTSAKTVAEGRQPGDWGGIVLLGKAGFNINNGVNNIEGITASVNTEYGGGAAPDDNDNSGTLKYVRIEFGGYVFSPNNEINGLTMGAVGKGTTIDYVQVSYANDDAFEWFGGSVNCKHLVAYRNLDDDFDTDNGYKGLVQYVLGIKDPSIADNPSVSTSEGFESDNNAAGTTVVSPNDNTSAIFTNVTLIGPAFRATLSPSTTVATGHERPLRLRRATQLKVYNSIFMDFKNNFVFIDGSAAVANANGGTLKFKNNIIAGTPNASFTGGVNPTSLNSWFTSNGNSFLSSSTGLLATPYGSTNTYLGLDYRPTGVAASGADFADSSIAPYVVIVTGSTPQVTNVTYCKGTVASPLTATLTTTGVSLKWYTLATGGTAATTAPTPTTTVVGVKTYYVSQVDTNGVESARVPLTVTILALPTEVLSAITGVGPAGSTSATAVGPYVATTAQFTYSISTFVDTSLSYLWTVPNGVNIVSGQGTNSIVVNYLNVPPGAGNVGSIQVQAVNANGCKTLAKSLLITKALPAAPTVINFYDRASATPTTALTSYAKYMGSTTPITILVSTVPAATGYEWELPSGVQLSLPSNTPAPVVTTVTYTAEPFYSPASTPTTVGTKYWVVTFNKYTVDVNGESTDIVVSTCQQRIVGSGAYGATTSQNYPRYGTKIVSNKPSILVNFSGVNNSATTALYFGVKSVNGVGTSVTTNATNADVVAGNIIPGLYYTSYNEVFTPVTPPSTNATSVFSVASTTVVKNSKLKKLVAAIPAAPTTVKLFNDAISSTTAVTIVSKYIGTTTPLRLLAAVSPTASSYSWELPSGVNQVSGGNTNEIVVNFAGVAPGTTVLYLGVKAVNGIGSSITNNAALTPATTSTAKLLKVTATVPAAVSIVSGQITGICGDSTYTYTITASPLANSYVITGPVGSIVTSASNPSNGSSSLSTSDLTFSVTMPANFATITPKTIVISAVNGVGASLTNKTLTLSTALSPIGVATGGTTFTRCATQTFSVPEVPGAVSYTWLPAAGATIVSGQGTNTVVVDFSAVPTTATSNLLKVTATNGCGVSSAAKSISLTSVSCARESQIVEENPVNEVSIVRSEVYPNPTYGAISITVENELKGSVEVAIFSMDGYLVNEPKTIQLEEGVNTIQEDLSRLEKGIYIVKLISSSNKEVVVKKVIKQ
ncbi:T9SS type A sorting domain-containing protein [Flavobacterium sp. N1719]|uniref:T9SS type A sorting domain-containing protein n=1 Tax=Flavobacterium sp. N1719 TaxID=2885633 RepID=UPI0022233FB3|nr:T9SS type A sorting domain-containing protein [Flavobacterium sp. N1719]